MDKLSSILVVVEDVPGGLAVLDKAVQIARCFQARIELMVGDLTQAGTFADYCTRHAYDEALFDGMLRGAESLDDVILRRVRQRCPDLIITQLQEHDWRLVQECTVPIMLVGARPWSQPLRLAAAVDVAARDAEAVTRSILQCAGFLALGSHADLDILYSECDERDETLRMKRAVKLAQLVREFHVGSEHLQIFSGQPGQTLPAIIAARRYDVLVLGAVTHRSGVGAGLDGDLLLVKAAGPGEIRVPVRPESRRQQIPDKSEQFV